MGLLRRLLGGGAERPSRLEAGLALHAQRRFEEALEPLREAYDAGEQPALAAATLAEALRALGDEDQADYFIARALEADPSSGPAHVQRGVLAQLRGELQVAETAYRNAIAHAPDTAVAWMNLGLVLEQRGEFAAARQHHEQAVRLRPDWAEARFNLALQLLLQGEYARGWEEYEWRWRREDLRGYTPHAGRPRWDGGTAPQTVLVYCEQGFGDSLQFLRFVPGVRERAGRVLLECPPKLAPLFRRTPGIDAVIARGETVPAFDSCVALLGLPRLLGTTLQSIPRDVPYVHPDPARAAHWAARLATDPSPLKVGLFWATESGARTTAQRTLSLQALAPLAKAAGASFYSLQRGDAARQANAPPAGLRITDLSGELTDFADDAALMVNLDLVISMDTATAHLAGALGRPAWVLTHFPPPWNWMLEREDSPWYPSVRLFRQAPGEGWAPVIERIAGALVEWPR